MSEKAPVPQRPSKCPGARLVRTASLLVVAAVAGGCGEPPEPPTPVERTVGAVQSDSAQASSSAAAAPAALHVVEHVDGDFTVRWSSKPDPIPSTDPFIIEFELFEDAAMTRPIELPATDVAVDAAMPHHGHGMNVKPRIEALGGGRYRAVGMLFHMPGRWEIFFDASFDGRFERAQTTVTLP